MMIYRMRTYQAVPESIERFNAFFEEHLLPTQLRHGARLVGRWSTEDGRIVAIWNTTAEPSTTGSRRRSCLIP